MTEVFSVIGEAKNVAVRIRLKQLGRKHRPYYRICVMDARSPRDGKTIEEIGTYDPMIRETDKRVSLKGERYDYWLSVGALPTDHVKRLAEKYKGNVPAVRIDERKVREVAVAPKKAEPRRVKPQPAAAPVEEAAPAAETTETATATEETPASE